MSALGSALNEARRQIFLAVNRNGASVMCLYCGWRGKHFYKAKQRCPQCDSLPRTRLIAYAVGHFGIHLNYADLMVIGPNIQEIVYLSTHFTPRRFLRVDMVKRGFINYAADITKLSLESDQIDVIISWHVLEHISEDRAAIREMYRVLKPGGSALISVPIHPPGRENTYEDSSISRSDYQRIHGHPDHVRSCGLDYGQRFAEAGFSVQMLSVAGDVDENDREFLGLSSEHVAWHCVKPAKDERPAAR